MRLLAQVLCFLTSVNSMLPVAHFLNLGAGCGAIPSNNLLLEVYGLADARIVPITVTHL